MDSKIFSLEIFIDRIRLAAGEKCLFPSTILKLLSYEPALISSVDNKIQENLREYIDHVQKLGNVKQIDQLKDVDGNYIIRKGKSILFEATTVSLMNELSVLPVYVLVTDDYYSPSHLVGVVAINLSSVMNRLAQKISNKSITVSEETSGRFPIVTLMGNGIGALALRLRLIYIGENIGRHVAQEQEMEIRPKLGELRETAQKSVGAESPIRHNGTDIVPPMTVVRTIGCQVDEKRSIRIQVPPKSPPNGFNRAARIGLSIDPNDPLLEGPPPLIYNSHYNKDYNLYEDDYSDCVDKDTTSQKQPDIMTCAPLPVRLSPRKQPNKDMPILNALFSELKAWKSEDFVEQTITTLKKPKVVNRSKSVDVRPPINGNPTEFLRRMSKPKVRPLSPTGIVPRNLGWIRTEPQFIGPKKSLLEYKLTKTQLRRIELRNPRMYNRLKTSQIERPHSENGESGPRIHGQLPPSRTKSQISPTKRTVTVAKSTDEASATTYTELPPKQRHPLVPPLFNPGTSISVPSFTQTESSSQIHHRRDIDIDDRSQRLPPKSPDRQRNNNSQTISFETNGTLEEADHFLNLNPVQSNRSPQMTLRSQTIAVDTEQDTEEEEEEDNGNDSYEDRRPYRYNNRSEEYSDEFNGSLSSSNGPISLSRRYSNASQISQTSEWRTECSRGSSVSQNYLNRQESPPQSPDIGTYRSPPKSPIKSRRSLLVSGVVPGGRFSDLGSSRQMKFSDSFAASFDEAAERTNYTTSGSLNVVTERDREHETMRSFDQFDSHPTRPVSPGADVTSFTKVTKFDRSLAPGRQSNNYLGTNYLTSTVASMQTDDSQMLTSDSFS